MTALLETTRPYLASEFDTLAEEARDLGLDDPVPTVRRYRILQQSALAWREQPSSVVAIHGAALNAHAWDGTLLAWQTPALALDLPGHGESPWRHDANYDPAVLAPEIAEAIGVARALGLATPRVTLVGHSLGGLVALEVARIAPYLVDHVILVDSLPLPPGASALVREFLNGPSSFASREEIAERARAFGFGGTQGALERSIWHNTRDLPDGRVAWKHHLGVLGGAALPERGLEEGWGAIATLAGRVDLIWGTRGLINAASRAHFTALRPDARIIPIEAGSNIHEDAPLELAAALSKLAGPARP
ncbi:MAG: alpha/beta fold hydrolase [Bifidobacteriaceae bacterium]|jgi:pimeloyl-ACP methyl ester carboxylesterase|nr:alpha/beta fold hydrolase [Bifidobacteriaceae bacterium]